MSWQMAIPLSLKSVAKHVTSTYLIITTNIIVSSSIALIHFNSSIFKKWDLMTQRYALSHYLIWGLNVYVAVTNILLLKELLTVANFF